MKALVGDGDERLAKRYFRVFVRRLRVCFADVLCCRCVCGISWGYAGVDGWLGHLMLGNYRSGQRRL